MGAAGREGSSLGFSQNRGVVVKVVLRLRAGAKQSGQACGAVPLWSRELLVLWWLCFLSGWFLALWKFLQVP